MTVVIIRTRLEGWKKAVVATAGDAAEDVAGDDAAVTET